MRMWTFGDSILDCAHYNEAGIHPAGLLAERFGVELSHCAVDGATVDGLERQLRGAGPGPRDIILLTVGGNDLLRGLLRDAGAGVARFEATLEAFAARLPTGRVLLGNVYDPTFGRDEENPFGVDPRVGRANHRRVNEAIARVAARHGALVDLHARFLRGDASWYTRVIEPSEEGARQVAEAFAPHVARLLGRQPETSPRA